MVKWRAKRNVIEGGGVLRQNVNNEKQKGRPTLKNLKDVQWMIEGDNDVIVLTSTLDIGRPANIGVSVYLSTAIVIRFVWSVVTSANLT